ncbi:phosphoserine phosphatase SerB [Rhizosphaericola mali]|uniref:Phosphoserine phosphatase n=1 Tax=Rhizosphaericola mali TaxID=2545455 RepID=A0A5P2FZR1_9BACT|nr:phosphoserine phosphatase SerB [Rhizosphaericola mali]QES89016.1 phosphoserine phosphatase SerB [Rhizosphaericola mali]
MKLVVQGANLTDSLLAQFTILSGALSFTQISDKVYRFDYANNLKENQIQILADSEKIDVAFLEEDVSLSDFKLLAMDMDCTFIQIECIDEIADMNGLKSEVAAITKASMCGEMDFNESLTKRVALLKGLDASALNRVFEERLQLSPGAEKLLQALNSAGIKTLLVSGGFTYFTERLQAKYGIDFTRANTLEVVDGKLTGNILGTIINAEEKAKTLLRCCEDLKITSEQTIAIGDGANDMKMLATAGMSIAYHAKPKVKAAARYTLNYVGLDGVINMLS